MYGSTTSLILASCALVASGAALVLAASTGPRSERALSRTGAAAAVLLPAASLALFCSLAVRVQRELGGWPRTIGMQELSPGLAGHAALAYQTFGALVLAGLVALPLASLVCACAPRLRLGLRYLGLFAIAGVATLGAMQLAPEPFLYWWWD